MVAWMDQIFLAPSVGAVCVRETIRNAKSLVGTLHPAEYNMSQAPTNDLRSGGHHSHNSYAASLLETIAQYQWLQFIEANLARQGSLLHVQTTKSLQEVEVDLGKNVQINTLLNTQTRADMLRFLHAHKNSFA